MNTKDWLELNANIEPSPITNDEDGRVYRSKEDGSYIGRVHMEEHLDFLAERNLTQLQNYHGDSACSASIGFNEEEQKWYGWSHRAIYGFTIGSEVIKGDCAYQPTDKDDFLEDMVRFWTETDHINVVGEHTDEGVQVSWVISDDVPNEKIRGEISGCMTEYPDSYGKGEWVAETMDDAKQMACDFAAGVS